MTKNQHFPPPLHTVSFLVFNGFQLLDLAGPLAAFEVASIAHKPARYRLRVSAATAGPVRSSSGATIEAEAVSNFTRDETVIVVGGAGTMSAIKEPALLALLRSAASSGARLCSVCSGSFLLAAAGLLDRRTATTHWRYAPMFASNFPKVRLQPDRIFVQDGSIWTSAGVTAGIDLALALIARDLGEEVARSVAQELVVYHRRMGGQSQHSALLDSDRAGGRFGGLLSWVRDHLALELNVDQLAEQAGMSSRNFARAFRAEFGTTPAKAVERIRVDVARSRLEGGSEPLSTVSRECGFGDPDRMRRAFNRVFGQTPQSLRRLADARTQPEG
ncbi:helix-turn-helix domain-containing protein [bacterium]|nr:helix-turn-helix domain-containing protein [bacterium]